MDLSMVYKTGCGQVFFSDHALEEVGPALRRYGTRILSVAGEHALAAAGDRIRASLAGAGLEARCYPFRGECSWANVDALTEFTRACAPDVILAVGGGKCADACKIAADRLDIHAAMVPTVAATCASYVPGSIVYTDDHRPNGGAANRYENVCVFIDTQVLRAAPERYLASGMADALAKYYELYPAGAAGWSSFRTGGGYDSSVLSGFDLARSTRELLEAKGVAAYRQNAAGVCGEDLINMLFTVIVTTGVISGLSGGTGQLQVAHNFHNSLKRAFPEQMHRYLHGELVGTGILVQMVYNGNTDEELERVRRWLEALSIPVKLAQYGVTVTREHTERFAADLARIVPNGGAPETAALLRRAVAEVL